MDKYLKGNKIAPLQYACLASMLRSALVLKGCNLNAPLALIHQFLIALFFIFLTLCNPSFHLKMPISYKMIVSGGNNMNRIQSMDY